MSSLRISPVSQFLVLILLLVVKCSAQFNLTSLPACVQNCFEVSIRSQTDCNVNDTTCLCGDQTVSNSLRYCLESSCTYSDLVAARNFALQYCPSFAPTTTTSSNASSTSSAAAGDSTQSVDKANTGLATGTKIGIGVVVPIGVLFIVFGFLFYRHIRKERRRNSLPPPVTSSTPRSSSRSRSRSQSRSRSRARSSSVVGKRSSKSEMRQSSRTARSSIITPVSFEQKTKSFNSTLHSRNTSSATATNTTFGNIAGATGMVPITSASSVAGKRGVTFDADLEKTNSNGGSSSNSSTSGSLGKVGSNSSSYRSLSPIAEPVSMLQARPGSAAKISSTPMSISVYDNRERLHLPYSPPYAQHQSEPLPPPSPTSPLRYVFAENEGGVRPETAAGVGRVSAVGEISRPYTASAAETSNRNKKSKKKEEPRWKQWKDRQSSLSGMTSPTSSTPKLDSMYNAI